jgi:hypothetical protein
MDLTTLAALSSDDTLFNLGVGVGIGAIVLLCRHFYLKKNGK